MHTLNGRESKKTQQQQQQIKKRLASLKNHFKRTDTLAYSLNTTNLFNKK